MVIFADKVCRRGKALQIDRFEGRLVIRDG
jgi:hypothetical protein